MTRVWPTGFRYRAECDCGWRGKKRWTQCSARCDAWEHNLKTRCVVDCPLVQPFPRDNIVWPT